MTKLVRYVLHKESKEKRLIKADRFNPEYHKELPGKEGEPFTSQAGKNSTASGIIVPDGTKQPNKEAEDERKKAQEKADAEKATEVEKAKADADADAKDKDDVEMIDVEVTQEMIDSDPEAFKDIKVGDTVQVEKKDTEVTAESLDNDFNRKELDKMALELGYSEEDIKGAKKKADVIEMILKGNKN